MNREQEVFFDKMLYDIDMAIDQWGSAFATQIVMGLLYYLQNEQGNKCQRY
jgi:hypothetical protein